MFVKYTTRNCLLSYSLGPHKWQMLDWKTFAYRNKMTEEQSQYYYMVRDE
jgi:hypothetical protein